MKVVIIFSGFNQRAIIAFLRTLEKNNVCYYIIASSKDDPIFLSKYSKNVLVTRKYLPLNLEDIIHCIKTIKIKSRADKMLIAPSTEALNRFLLQNIRQFNKLDCEIPLVSKKLYEEISDKYTFSNLCKKNSITIPKEYKNISKTIIPYVAKPKKYFSESEKNLSPILVFNKTQHKELLKTNNPNYYYYQEYLKGKSFYLLYYIDKNKTITKLSQENYIQQPQGKHIVAAISSGFHLKQESTKYEKMLKNINFRGLIMIEVRVYKNKNYMIEANPRFWGPSQLFVDSGINLFESFLFDYLLIDKKPSFILSNEPTRYYWHSGVLETQKIGGKLKFFNYSKNSYKTYFKKWMSVDIYNRNDTKKIYLNEIKCLNHK